MTQPPLTQPAPLDVAIIGGGFGGIATGIALRSAGWSNFAIFERAQAVGGVWRDNIYPGCACDIQSHLYELAARPNPDWTANYAGQAEILAYLTGLVEQEGLRAHLRLGADIQAMRFDAASATWELVDALGGTAHARAVVMALGPHSRPVLPQIPGIGDFAGIAVHSAAWPEALDLAGLRVAVIGTGASAIQIVPRIAPVATHLTVFQRSPPWVVPRRGRTFGALERGLLRHLPAARQMRRLGLYWMLEGAGAAVLRKRVPAAIITRMARRNLERAIADPALRRALTPDYPIGCKRILVSDDYYPALARPNVALVTSPIRAILPGGVETADGARHELDAIVYATGFRVADAQGLPRIEGPGGRVLGEEWARSGMAAHLGTHVAGYPNLAILLGPNTGPASASAIHVMESQLRRVVPWLEAIRRAPSGTALDVDAARQEAYNRAIQEELQATAWNAGCSSWYLDGRGRNTTMYPGLTSTFRRRIGRFDLADYLWREEAAPAAPEANLQGRSPASR